MNKSNGYRVNGTFFEVEVTISKVFVYWYFIIWNFFQIKLNFGLYSSDIKNNNIHSQTPSATLYEWVHIDCSHKYINLGFRTNLFFGNLEF